MPAKYIMASLGVLMCAHLSMLGYASVRCFEQTTPGPVCTRMDGSFQQAVETYVALLLALMARPIMKQ